MVKKGHSAASAKAEVAQGCCARPNAVEADTTKLVAGTLWPIFFIFMTQLNLILLSILTFI